MAPHSEVCFISHGRAHIEAKKVFSLLHWIPHPEITVSFISNVEMHHLHRIMLLSVRPKTSRQREMGPSWGNHRVHFPRTPKHWKMWTIRLQTSNLSNQRAPQDNSKKSVTQLPNTFEILHCPLKRITWIEWGFCVIFWS